MIYRIAFLFIIILMTGCATVNYDDLLNYQPSQQSYSKEKFNKTIAFQILLDKRPSRDKSFTRKVEDFPKQATIQLSKHFEGIFEEVHFPPTFNEDIIIEGDIDRFRADAGPAMIFSPFDFKVTTYSAITLKIKDGKTGNIIAEIKETQQNWNGGCWKIWDMTLDLNNAFNSTARKLKDKCIKELEKYFLSEQSQMLNN